MKQLIPIVALIAIVAGSAYAAPRMGGQTQGRSHDSVLASMPVEPLNDAERNALLYMIEEEKMARDVYTYLADEWNVRTFENIASAEQQHMESVRSLLTRYELPVPGTLETTGAFTDAALQQLYDELIQSGGESMEAAFIVGATIEDVDLSDLHNDLESTDNEDITMVFQNLIAGSENHMRAFVNQLERLGAHYEPQYIDAAYYEEIIASARGGNRWARRN